MAKRKRKNEIPVEALLKAGAILLVLATIGSALQSTGAGGALFLLILIVGGGGVVLFLPGYLAQQRVVQTVSDSVNVHIEVLVRKRAQTLQPDPYGAVQPDKWYKEIEYFLDTQVAPRLNNHTKSALNARRPEWRFMIDQLVSEAQGSNPAFAEFSESMSPAEFEVFCAEQLRRAGWKAYVSKAGRDQGVDVVADKSDVRLVLQCKLYSQPVGNAAVQEVVAAKGHEHANVAAVVTNNRYTAPAQELANTNGVLLLHYSDLCKIDSLITTVLIVAHGHGSRQPIS